tara:strand:+ start:1151 stop:1852 length:702 start_codon:yes stop_codon:yes gene_type:complete
MNSSKSKKYFTLIICCHNHEEYLFDCLKSILNQKKHKFKFDIIFVDDCSKDSSLKIAKKILPKKNAIIIKNSKNLGLSKSCNKALRKTKTKYFIRIDSDDYISNEFIYFFEKSININSDLIFCDRIEFTKSKKKIFKNKKKNIFKMISCGVAMKTKKVLKIGGYKNLMWEEYDLYLRYLDQSPKIKNIKKNLYFYRKHNQSMSFKKTWIKKAWIQLRKKYSSKYINKFGRIES